MQKVTASNGLVLAYVLERIGLICWFFPGQFFFLLGPRQSSESELQTSSWELNRHTVISYRPFMSKWFVCDRVSRSPLNRRVCSSWSTITHLHRWQQWPNQTSGYFFQEVAWAKSPLTAKPSWIRYWSIPTSQCRLFWFVEGYYWTLGRESISQFSTDLTPS